MGTLDQPPERASVTGVEVDSLDRLETAWQGSRDGAWWWDVDGGAAGFSPRWKEILGHTEDEVEGRPEEWFRRVHPRDLDELKRALATHVENGEGALEREFRVLHKDGSWRWVVCRCARHAARGILGGSLTDLTSIKNAENQLLHEAFHDPLTGLPNKELFVDRLGLCLSRRRRRDGPPVAVFYLDLDRFHAINKSLGVEAGDELLIEVTERLRRRLRLGDTLARMSGDKFAVLADGVRGPRHALRIAKELVAALKQPLHLAGHEIFVSASIGVAVSGPEDDRAEDLLRDAATAMHRAKEDGATDYELFDPRMNAEAKERLRLEADLHHALERGDFVLHYHPIVSLETGSIAAFEALVRWQHPDRGLIRPDLFVPLAEETGMIVPLGSWVLGEASRQMRDWRERLPASAEVSMAVNLSARQFEDDDLIQGVGDCLERTGLDPCALELEMTESVVMARTRENASTLQALRDLGIRLHIDDFGTGYSSLASLQSFPLDSLKIDRSFVTRMEHEEGKAEIVRTILALARTLGLEVVAEGVETREALDMLRALECHHAQGYFFSTPLDGPSAEAWMENPPRW